MFQKDHLSEFQKCVHANQQAEDRVAKPGKEFAKGLPDVDVAVLPEKKAEDFWSMSNWLGFAGGLILALGQTRRSISHRIRAVGNAGVRLSSD